MRLAKRSPWLTTGALLVIALVICGALAFLTPLTASVEAAGGKAGKSQTSEVVTLDSTTTVAPSTTKSSTNTCTNAKGSNTCSSKLTSTTKASDKGGTTTTTTTTTTDTTTP